MKLQQIVKKQLSGEKSLQYFLTIPKTLVDTMGWGKGDEIHPAVHGKDMILLRKVKKSD